MYVRRIHVILKGAKIYKHELKKNEPYYKYMTVVVKKKTSYLCQHT